MSLRPERLARREEWRRQVTVESGVRLPEQAVGLPVLVRRPNLRLRVLPQVVPQQRRLNVNYP